MPEHLVLNGSPLFLEPVRLPHCGATEIENTKPAIARELEATPVQEHVRSQVVVFPDRRGPRNSSFSLKPRRNPEAKGIVPLNTVHIQEFSVN
jgi:hypothetical protein